MSDEMSGPDAETVALDGASMNTRAECAALAARCDTQAEFIEKTINDCATLEAERDALAEEVARLREVDRLAGVASRWHWFGSSAVDEYEDSDDLFQDLDNARGKALAASRAHAALKARP